MYSSNDENAGGRRDAFSNWCGLLEGKVSLMATPVRTVIGRLFSPRIPFYVKRLDSTSNAF